jgi:hypothetical protein
MLTRAGGTEDLDGFFWRQVVARSPQTRVTGTPYDDAWRAMNQRLTTSSIASHQRNVLLRNDGRGGFDEVSGTVGLDLDQDGRSFGVLDLDGDLDPDLVLMAARQVPQLRVFRNDYAGRHAALALRLRGTASNRDAVGARVSIETDLMRRTSRSRPARASCRSTRRSCCSGWARSRKILKLVVDWPSGKTQVFTDVPLDRRLRLTEGEASSALRHSCGTRRWPRTAAPPRSAPPCPADTWLYEPVRRPLLASGPARGNALARRARGASGRAAGLVGRAPQSRRRAPGARGGERSARDGRRGRGRAGDRRARRAAAGPRRGLPGRPAAGRAREPRGRAELCDPETATVDEPAGLRLPTAFLYGRRGPRV